MAPSSASAATGPRSVQAGRAVGVPAGDYLLTMTVSTTYPVPIGGIVTQHPGGGAEWDRVYDFVATASPRRISAVVRTTAPTDTFVPIATWAPQTLRVSNLVLTAARWGDVVRGPDIVAPSGAKVIWHGINSNPAWTIPGTVDAIHAATRADVIRVPVFEEQWLPYFKLEYTPGYRQQIINEVNAVTRDGMTAIVLLTSAGHDDPNFDLGYSGTGQLAPDQQSIVFWRDAASLWANNPNVVFELFNEPQMRASDPELGGRTGAQVWRDGGKVTAAGATWTAPGMQQLLDRVRSRGAWNPVLIDGTGWAGDLTPVTTNPIDGTNIVYAFHAYTDTGDGEDPTTVPAHLPTLVAPVMDPAGLRYATLATEVGTTEEDPPDGPALGSEYFTNTLGWISAHGAGWLVWGWYPWNWGDNFGMLWSLPVTLTTRAQTVVGMM